MLRNKYLVVIPGIILAFVLYTLSQGFNNIIGIELLGYEKSPISTAVDFFISEKSSFITGQCLYVCGGMSVGHSPI